ncbi:histidine kinase [Pseudomonas protegens]|uniref:ATP-binding protein n=1 Tax=Pseudomonas protegens TaxID=380021 RepID=UPI000368C606|nr:histidine kinase [Pseudomonas protegens]ROM36076.1 histidine kinase [Pseudomonas protegens]
MRLPPRPLFFVLILWLALPVFAQDRVKIRARQPLDFLDIRPSIDEQTWLRNKEALLVGIVSGDLPPYREINQRHELEGIGADYLGALQRELAIPVEVRTYPNTDAAYHALRSGEVDLVDSATQVEAEDYQVRLSPSYAVTELALYAESGDLRDYRANISRTRIAATRGMALELYLRTGGRGLIQLYDSPRAAMGSVLDGDADIYLGDSLSTGYLSSQLFSDQLVISHSARLPEIQVGFAVARDNTHLQQLLERALGGIKRCQVISALQMWGGTGNCDSNSFRERLDADQRLWLEHAPPVRLVISDDLAPYAFFNSRGLFNGIASDLLDLIRRKSGLRFEVSRVGSLKQVDTRLREGRADLSILARANPRRASYLYTRPIVTTPYVIVRKTDAPPLAPLNRDSIGSVALASGYLQSEDLRERYPRLWVQQTSTVAEALNRVRQGKADFTLAPANLANYYLSFRLQNSLKIHGMMQGLEARIAFAAPQSQQQLIAIIDQAMAEISPQEYLQILGRWRASGSTDDSYWKGVTAFTWKILGSLGLMLMLAAWWILSQRRRIIRKRLDLLQRQLILDQLRDAKEAAEHASRSKTVFLTTMSHEIRTPLSAIVGMLELVLTRDNDRELNTRSVHIAYESAQNLLALIGHILDISRIESGRLTLRPEAASLKDLIESVANVFDGLARQKHLDIHLQFDAWATAQVWIDGLKFKQIISNLLSNAIKFTEQGEIHIRCLGQVKDEHFLDFHVEVIDTGPGIPASQIQKIFTPFFEVDSVVSNPNAGSGLGLSISHSLTQLMNGSLQVQSELGVGTRMTFKACFQRVADERSSTTDSAEQTVLNSTDQPLCVLIVEDHLPSQYLLNQQINYLGHEALIAYNGLEGLAMWQEHDVDIIITDCNMPQMSGHEMSQAIRRMEGQMGVRPCTIIGLTASAQLEELERCLASGMDSALAKPISLAGLNRLIPKLSLTPPQAQSAVPSVNGDIHAALAEHVINSNNEELQALSKALASGNRQALKAIAHKLKGTAYLLNAQGLLELCVSLEELVAEAAQEQQLSTAVARLDQALRDLNQSLQVY